MRSVVMSHKGSRIHLHLRIVIGREGPEEMDDIVEQLPMRNYKERETGPEGCTYF